MRFRAARDEDMIAIFEQGSGQTAAVEAKGDAKSAPKRKA